MIVYMYPGQGAQTRGMGSELFERYPGYTRCADEVLGYSIAELCIHDREQQLDATAYTQPALFVVDVLSHLRQIEQTGQFPDAVLGHSLGEYAALFAAGVFDFETGLRLVQKRGELMSQAAEGGMAAVLDVDATDVARLLREGGCEDLDLANHNTPAQVVISGPKASIGRAASVFERAGARYVVLRVGGAFHSRYMRPAQQAFDELLAQQSLRDPRLTVISNVTAQPYEAGQARQLMTQQIASQVRFSDSIDYLQGLGASSFVELGPGQTLTGLVRAREVSA